MGVSVIALVAARPACAQPVDRPAAGLAASSPGPSAEDDLRASTVFLNRRPIVTFRTELLGRSAAARASTAQTVLLAAVERGGPGKVSVWSGSEAAGLKIDDEVAFYMVAADIAPGQRVTLEQAAAEVRQRLQVAVDEGREVNDPRSIGRGIVYSAAATVIAYVLMRLAFALRRRVATRLAAHLDSLHRRTQGQEIVSTFAEYVRTGTHVATTLATWCLIPLLLDVWITFVLRQFAYTRPWGERSTAWLLGVLEYFALAIAGAVPGLLTALLIFIIARLASRAAGLFLLRVERGDIHVGWLDRDTAGPTRRIGNFVIWLFALAMAYPYLPGSNSEAFKGVSVLAGLMLSFGASSVVGQAMSGLSLMYSKSLRAGEYVKIGDIEGTVTVVGMFATKVHTGMGEEVSVPNTVASSQPVRNYSRLVKDGEFMLHTAVTIGYSTPWRQVHAMLLEAARRTAGVSQDPPPYVVQTALSDFYVEYRLCAQSNKNAPRRRVEAMNQLHAHVLDVFNENGVQIMSPHYMADPPQPQVVPPGAWSPALATAPAAPKDP